MNRSHRFVRTKPLTRSPIRRAKGRRRGGWKSLGIPQSTLVNHFGQNPRCQFPGCEQPASELHHVLPRGRGGPNELSNLLPVCSESHRWIHAHPIWAECHGLLLPRGRFASDPDVAAFLERARQAPELPPWRSLPWLSRSKPKVKVAA